MRQYAFSRCGCTLTEMLFLISILGVLFLLEGQLSTASLRVVAAVPTAQAEQAAMQQIATILRRDVWNAARIEIAADDSMTLTDGAGASIRWQFALGNVTRGSLHWKLAAALQPIQDGPGVTLRTKSPRADMIVERRFISQTLLAKELK